MGLSVGHLGFSIYTAMSLADRGYFAAPSPVWLLLFLSHA